MLNPGTEWIPPWERFQRTLSSDNPLIWNFEAAAIKPVRSSCKFTCIWLPKKEFPFLQTIVNGKFGLAGCHTCATFVWPRYMNDTWKEIWHKSYSSQILTIFNGCKSKVFPTIDRLHTIEVRKCLETPVRYMRGCWWGLFRRIRRKKGEQALKITFIEFWH